MDADPVYRAAILTFLVSAEMLFSEERGIVWAAEPHMDFFVSFIERAIWTMCTYSKLGGGS